MRLARGLIAGGRPGKPALSYITNGDHTATTAGSTISGVSFGAAHRYRYVVVALFRMSNTSGAGITSTVSIGGVTATQLVGVGAGGTEDHASLWIALVPSGTTGDIVYTSTTAGAVDATGYAVYRLIWRSITPFHTASNAVSGSNVSTAISLNIPSNGVLIAASLNLNGTNPTWTNATKDFGIDINSNEWASSASATGLSSQTGRSISASSRKVIVAASFG